MTPLTEPEVLLEHREFLRALALSLLRDPQEADDVVQQAWLKALEQPPRQVGSLRSWLATVVRNLASNWRRDEQRRGARERAAAKPEAATSSPAEILQRLSVQEKVVQAVLALEEPYRTAIVLRFYEDLPPREIARQLDVPVETIRSRIQRGLRRLRGKLDDGSPDCRRALLAGLVALAGLPRATVAMPVGSRAVPKERTMVLAKVAATTVALVGAWVGGRHLWEFLGEVSRGDEPAVIAGELDPIERQPTTESASALAESLMPAAEPGRGESPAPPSTRSEGSSVSVQVTIDDTAPADVGVYLRPAGQNAFLLEREARTDETGAAIFTGVSPGRYAVLCDRGDSQEIELGESGAAVSLSITGDVTVHGIVVDESGAPISDARILLSQPIPVRWWDPMSLVDHPTLRWSFGKGVEWTLLVGETDPPWLTTVWGGPEGKALAVLSVAVSRADGTFRVDGVPRTAHLAARAPGHGPSVLQNVRVATTAEDPLRVVLQGAGGSVAGQVLAPDGSALANALVEVDELEVQGTRDGSGINPPPRPARTRTDEAGRFRIEGVSVGRQSLQVRAVGLASGRFVSVEAGAETGVEIRLAPGAICFGVVRGESGEAVPGVRVEVMGFASAWTETDAEGRYRLEGLRAGSVDLIADGGSAGRIERSVSLSAGEERPLDLRLSRGRTVRGRVVDEEGLPLTGYEVSAQAGGLGGATRTDEEGRFTLANIDAQETSVKVRESPFVAPTFAIEEDIPSQGEELTIVIGPERRYEAFFIGRIVSGDGQGISGVEIQLEPSARGKSRFVHRTDEDGRFKTGFFRAGRYRLRAESAEHGALALGLHSLAPDELVDLGTFTLQAPGQLRLEVRHENGQPLSGDASARLFGGEGERVDSWSIPNGGTLGGVPVQPGDHVLRLQAPGFATHDRPISVVSGETTSVTAWLSPGVARTFVFPAPEDVEPLAEVSYRIAAESGLPILEGAATNRANEGDPLREWVSLTPGHYTITASAPGLQGSLAFEVIEGAGLREPLEVKLER